MSFLVSDLSLDEVRSKKQKHNNNADPKIVSLLYEWVELTNNLICGGNACLPVDVAVCLFVYNIQLMNNSWGEVTWTEIYFTVQLSGSANNPLARRTCCRLLAFINWARRVYRSTKDGNWREKFISMQSFCKYFDEKFIQIHFIKQDWNIVNQNKFRGFNATWFVFTIKIKLVESLIYLTLPYYHTYHRPLHLKCDAKKIQFVS